MVNNSNQGAIDRGYLEEQINSLKEYVQNIQAIVLCIFRHLCVLIKNFILYFLS